MNVIVIGAGEVGTYIARFLSEARHNVVMIDVDIEKVVDIGDTLDVQALCRHGTDVVALQNAGAAKADLVLAVSNSDEVNFTAAHIAKRLGAKRTIVRARKPFYLDEYLSFYAGAFEVDRVVCPEVQTAMEIARLLENPGALEVIFFARGRLQMRRLLAEENAPGTGKPLKSIAFPTASLVASLGREDGIVVPGGDDEVRPGDTVTVIGPTGEIRKVQALFHTTPHAVRSVTVGGGGIVGFTLAQILERQGYKVRLLDRNPDRCKHLAETLSRTEVLHGDITHLRFLEEIGIQHADAFVAATNNDETNLMAALLMKQFGIEEIAVLVHRPDFAPLLKQAGITHALSPRYIMANTVMTALQRREIASVQLLDEGKTEIIELRIPRNARVSGKRIREAGIPKGGLIAAVVRRSDVIIPRGDTELVSGDTIVAYALSNVSARLEEALTRPA